MMKLMLASAMGFAWDMIKTGERFVAYAESWEATEARAGLIELMVWRAGRAVLRAGERLELGMNGFAMWIGYDDGEASGMVAS